MNITKYAVSSLGSPIAFKFLTLEEIFFRTRLDPHVVECFVISFSTLIFPLFVLLQFCSLFRPEKAVLDVLVESCKLFAKVTADLLLIFIITSIVEIHKIFADLFLGISSNQKFIEIRCKVFKILSSLELFNPFIPFILVQVSVHI